MRMPVHQLVGEPIQYIVNREVAFLARHLRIEQNLQQQIAQFTCQFLPIMIVDRFQDFIGFFEGIRLDGVEALLPVPWTASRSAEPRHDFNHPLEPLTCGGHELSL